MKEVKSIAVVGGGTAGLVAACILKKRLNIQVDIIRSGREGIVGVGEGSTEHWFSFCDFLGLSQYDFLTKCDATYKCGVMFDNWNTKKTYLHNIVGDLGLKVGDYRAAYAKLIAEKRDRINYNFYWENKIPKYFLGKENEWVTYQFHFDTYKLNDYLTEKAIELGCNVIDDFITEIKIENENIVGLVGEKQNYAYDFYIDATGFKKLLINKLGAKWKSSSKYLKVNSAFTFQTENKSDNFNIWTLARGMDAGWLFRIPVWERYGNGYIYDKNYIDRDDAVDEVQKLFGEKIDVSKTFEFDPGWLDRPWIGNCCAIGLSSAFMEPLEATSIGTSIQSTFMLMHKILNYDENSIKYYNNSFDKIMENIRDFIVLHYLVDRDDTAFWRNVSGVELPETLQEKLQLWKHKLPVFEDFAGDSRYSLFTDINYIVVMEGLGIINPDDVKKELSYFSSDLQKIITRSVEVFDNNNKVEVMSHKSFIADIRNKML